jgi:propionate CoA-transferase
LSQLPPIPLTADKVVALRAAKEVHKRELSIFGFGAAADVPLVMAEQGIFEGDGLKDYWFTTEHGSYGGIVMSGWQFSANLNPDAILDGVSQFDVIDGGLCRFAALAFAQFDQRGVVNVSKFGVANPGAGGFIDIAESATRLVFTGTFTTGGLEVNFEGGKLRIVKEGKVRKFTTQVEHITYSVIGGVKRGQIAQVITERAVFEVAPEGLILTEVAPGIDVRRDVLDQMEFAPWKVADDLKMMDAQFFIERPLQAQAG